MTLVLVTAPAMLLSGCGAFGAIERKTPDFETPLEWGNAVIATYGEADVPNVGVGTNIRLTDSDEAFLTDFPQGQLVEHADGECLERTESDLYTGAATWEAESAWRIRFTFADSTVTLFSGEAKFGSQDWREPRIIECGGSVKVWALQLICGNSGDSTAANPVEIVPCPWVNED